jgi:hypothetical protein
MGEISVYYVPRKSTSFAGKEREVAEEFWNLGIFLDTPDHFIDKRIREWKRHGRELPRWKHSFRFGSMGVAGSAKAVPVPASFFDYYCPRCRAIVSDAVHAAWFDTDSPVPLSERAVTCSNCGATTPSKNLDADEPFTFATFYVWISDIDESDWEPHFKETIESVLGPCDEFRAWMT